jgi:uncharacterized protein YijF (DUF1287 family)
MEPVMQNPALPSWLPALPSWLPVRSAWLLFCFLAWESPALPQDGPESVSFARRLSSAALALTREEVSYDPAYYVLDYPGGDVPAGKGVCSDVLIRAYRTLGIDLQKEVHEDMAAHFGSYPDLWGLERPDPSIDHRRVPNLITFFKRHGTVKPVTLRPGDYLPGDIVCWNLGGAVTHIGIVVDRKSRRWEGYQVVHNIGAGQVLEDCLFDYRIIGHYVYP